MRGVLMIAVGLFLAGCSVTAPVAVLTQRGDVLTGTATASLLSGTFEASNGVLTCAGSYDPLSTEPMLPITALCSDGRHASGMVLRDTGGRSGRGTLRLDGGETADFVFGRHAAAFTAHTR